jgi:hypothetical protein
VKENGSSNSVSETYPVAHALSTPPPTRPKVTIFRGSVADITDAGDILLSATSAVVGDECHRITDCGERWMPICIAAVDVSPRVPPNCNG